MTGRPGKSSSRAFTGQSAFPSSVQRISGRLSRSKWLTIWFKRRMSNYAPTNADLLHAFAQEHPEAIEGYIRMIACNVARDDFKARYSQKRGAGRDQESLNDIDPSGGSGTLGSADTMEREILLKQIDACLGKCAAGPDEERDRTIFWLYYQQGMSARAIAALPTVGLTPKGVESAILRLTRLVRERMVQLRSESGGKEPGRKRISARRIVLIRRSWF